MSHLGTAQVKAQQELVVSYTPIARLLPMLQESEQETMQHKFDICYMYMMAKKGVAFKKYTALPKLEVCHGADLGFAYCVYQVYYN